MLHTTLEADAANRRKSVAYSKEQGDQDGIKQQQQEHRIERTHTRRTGWLVCYLGATENNPFPHSPVEAADYDLALAIDNENC